MLSENQPVMSALYTHLTMELFLCQRLQYAQSEQEGAENTTLGVIVDV